MYVAQSIIEQELTEKAINDLIDPHGAMMIALDKHHSKNWDDAGVLVIDEPIAIYEQFKLLREEYNSRKPGTKVNRLIIFFDEIAETLDEIKAILDEEKRGKGKEAVEFIINTYRAFGTGGRKKYINFIGMNHSFNVKALGIDGFYRNCFVSLLFNDAARHYVQTNNKQMADSKRKDLYQWACEVMDNRYICLATGAIGDKKMRHPTHHEYPEVKDGNPPLNLQPIKQLPLTIKLVPGLRNNGRNRGVYLNGSSIRPVDSGTDSTRVDSEADTGMDSNPHKAFSSSPIPDYAPIDPAVSDAIGADSQADNIGKSVVDDASRLEQIHEFWASGKFALSVILPSVWRDIKGVEKMGSRAWRKARAEYKRLTGR
ncbi:MULTISPECIES: hypothetical protein [Aerosakkonema]|uniref:hypothetical protein n=1 Tax=Aerosakkonema TaxID=1246629 RepID=UPI0035B8EC9E